MYVPVTVRGDRRGVLSARLPAAGADPAGVRGLVEFATALGHEIATAERDTDLYLLARRTRRLTLAAEMQWQLLPGRGCHRPEFVIGAHLEPAYTVGGDNFDWSTDDSRLTLTVTDGMGRGIDASLLTSVTVGALRNARRAGVSLADQARLADQAVYAQFGGKVYASTLLLRFDLATGTVQAVDAGSPRLYRRRGNTVKQIELEAQLPLGMFEETAYEEQTFTVRPGDRLVAVSTGVHGAHSPDGSLFGEDSLRRALDAAPTQAPQEVARSVVASLIEHFGGTELTADAAVVCLDWNGRTDATPRRRETEGSPAPGEHRHERQQSAFQGLAVLRGHAAHDLRQRPGPPLGHLREHVLAVCGEPELYLPAVVLCGLPEQQPGRLQPVAESAHRGQPGVEPLRQQGQVRARRGLQGVQGTQLMRGEPYGRLGRRRGPQLGQAVDGIRDPARDGVRAVRSPLCPVCLPVRCQGFDASGKPAVC